MRRRAPAGATVTWFLAYALAGAVVGLLAGMLGIGGGMTLVPVLSWLFGLQALSAEHTVHLALGTAMASVVFTSSASVRAHHALGGVDWAIVRRMAPAMLLGTFASTLASGWLPQRVLAIAFAVIVYGGATQILLGRAPSASRSLPGPLVLGVVGLAIGTICGLVSAGGAFLTVPFMLFCGVPMKRAIGTGAAIGVPIAVVGTIGFVVSGLKVRELPPATLGFVVLPALAAIVAASVLTAPVGARWAHKLPVVVLKRIFALLLFVLATRMITTYA